MRKSSALILGLIGLTYIAACGGGSKSVITTVYDLPTPLASYPPVLGGAIQGTALALSNSVTTFAGSSGGFTDSTVSTSANFNRPIAVTTDGINLYVADYFNNAIRQVEIATGAVTTIAGSTSGFTGSFDAISVKATFNRPSGITTDGTNLYVTDSGNYTIRKINLSSKAVTTMAGGVGLSGSLDSTNGLDARFNGLNGVTTDGTSLYVTDSNHTIRRIVIASGAVTTLAGAPGTSGSTDGIPTAARFNQPARLTTDGPNLYVTDFANSTIRKIVLATGAVTTIAGAVGPGGTAGSHADASTGQGARFNQPNGITTDGSYLYVTDSYDNTVRKIALSLGTVFSGPVTTIAGSSASAGAVDGNGSAASFNSPIGIVTDGKSLFITDIENHRIRKIQ